MHKKLIETLEKQHDLVKQGDTRFRPKVWVFYVAEIQNTYTGEETIPVDKLKNKLDHVCIFNFIYSKCISSTYTKVLISSTRQ